MRPRVQIGFCFSMGGLVEPDRYVLEPFSFVAS